MSLYLASLNSGSNGNCYYVGNDQDAVLVDAGISCREIERRMQRLGLPMDRVRAIFVSHEHSDHIRGLPTLLKKYRFPLYITRNTRQNCGLYLYEELLRDFDDGAPIAAGSLQVRPFRKIHDAADPFSFTVSYNALTVGIFTDLGRVCANLVEHFRACHAALLEANYDPEMLDRGNYPWHLKQRIRGGRGHLSNQEALDLFCAHRTPRLRHLVLGHLSQHNNRPELVDRLFRAHAGEVQVTVASRHEEMAVICVDGIHTTVVPHHQQSGAIQLGLSFDEA